MNLLTMGRSFVGIQSMPNRYRVTGQRLLPKFAEVGRAVSLAPVRSDASVGPLFDQAAERERSNLPVAGVCAAENGADSRRQMSSGDLIRRSMARPSRQQRAAAAAMVQTELSLETVKVLRNDLSDADLEIRRCLSEREERGGASETTPQKRMLWGRLMERLLPGRKQQTA